MINVCSVGAAWLANWVWLTMKNKTCVSTIFADCNCPVLFACNLLVDGVVFPLLLGAHQQSATVFVDTVEKSSARRGLRSVLAHYPERPLVPMTMVRARIRVRFRVRVSGPSE